MKKTAEAILIEHFKDHFGKLIAELLFKQKVSKHGIANFEEMEISEKINFGEMVLDEIFQEFYGQEKIQNMKILYLLRFSINEAIGKIEQMLNKDSEMQIGHLAETDIYGAEAITNDLRDEEKIKFTFETSNLVDGLLMFTLDKETVIKFGILLIELMQGEKVRTFEVDEMKISAINEFFNILLPSFVEVIGNVFEEDVFYFPISFEDFSEKYFKNEVLFKPQKILSTEMHLKVGGFEAEGSIFFFIKELKEGVKKLVSLGAQSDEDIWEISPPKIFASKTNDTDSDVRKFMDELNLSDADISFLLELQKKSDFTNFSRADLNDFAENVNKNYFAKSSDHKKNTIKANLEFLFGL